MTNKVKTLNKENTLMKRFMIVAVMAVALVALMATPAFAYMNNFYQSWTTGVGNVHYGYSTASNKCNVCHSVHEAPVAGDKQSSTASNKWTVTDTDTQMLLRSTVANSCVYCHISTTIGGVNIYGGTSNNYYTNNGTTWSGSSFSHDGPPNGHANCSNCHSVHGANVFGASAAPYILADNYDEAAGGKTTPGAGFGIGTCGDIAGASVGNVALFTTSQDAIDGNLNPSLSPAPVTFLAQETVFCSQCHAFYQSTDATYGVGDEGWGTGGGGSGTLNGIKTHPMRAATNNFQASGSTIGANQTVAWASSGTCRNCHDAGNVLAENNPGFTNNSFPHYTAGSYRFMLSASDAAGHVDPNGGASNNGFGAVLNTVAWTNKIAVSATMNDGLCLKCHRDGAGNGVGLTF